MTAITTNTTAPRSSGIFSAIHGYFERRSTFQRTYKELAALSDRELDDIGIARGDIRRIAEDACA